MNDVISVQGLTKRFGGLCAVDDLTLSVPQGICFGLLGPNGAGKTTTIEMLEGILPPTSGHIELFGQPASKALYKRVGIQFQNTALPDYLKVRETLAMFASFYDQPMALDELISLCSLEEFVDQDARKLSGGQRQRMLLAMALVNEPDLVFLDEPTTGLDPQARRNFWSLIQAVKARGKSIVLTTHYMDEAEVLCDDIAIMDKGRIIERGSPTELLGRHFEGVMLQIPSANMDQAVDGVTWQHNADMLEVQTTQVDQLIQTLLKAGVSLTGMQVKSPNLEDLFLKLTGYALRG